MGYWKYKAVFEDQLGWKVRDCYAVHVVDDDDDDDDGLGSPTPEQDRHPVVSCVGLGEPIYFYVSAVFLLAGVTAAAIFCIGTAVR